MIKRLSHDINTNLHQLKMGLAKLTEKIGNLSEAGKMMCYLKDMSSCFQKLYKQAGELVLKRSLVVLFC